MNLYSVGENQIDPIYLLGTYDTEEKAIFRMMKRCEHYKDLYKEEFSNIEEFKKTKLFKTFTLIIHNLNEDIEQFI